MMLDERFSTRTPVFCTMSGSRGSAMLTRFCTCTCAVSGSVPIWKKTVSVICPVDELVDCM